MNDNGAADDPVEVASEVASVAAAPAAVTGLGPDAETELDPWAWAAVEHEALGTDVSAHWVTAVLVAHNASDWLEETLDGLRHLDVAPDRIIAIDHDSDDDSIDLLDAACDEGLIDAVYAGRFDAGFGDGIRDALAQDADESPLPAQPSDDDWLWLLHDDAAPAPDSLEQLLVAAVHDPTVDVTGPKLLQPRQRRRPHQLSELGVSISHSGRRELFLEPGEIDQGQRDEPSDRLGVSTCGMLVRLRVWRDLDGLSPEVPVFRDGVEFGWRARLAGYRVVPSPQARMVHRQVGRAGLRSGAAAGRRPGATDRALGLAIVAAHASRGSRPVVTSGLLVSCLLRALGFVLGKVPGRAVDELVAASIFLRQPTRVQRLRSRIADTAPTTEARRRAEALRPPWWSSLRLAGESVTTALTNRYTSIAGDLDTASIDELTGDDFAGRDDQVRRSPWLAPITVAVVAAVVLSLVAARRLLRAGALTGPALLPAPGYSGLWDAFVSSVPGAPDVGRAPWLGLLGLGSTILVGRPEWLVTLLLLFAVPLALVTVYPLVRALVEDRRVRLWVAVSYALLPALLGGTNQGRLGLAVFAVLLPLAALAGRALVLRRPGLPEAWRGAWGTGLVLVALVAFQPVVMVLALLAGLVAVATVARTPRKIGRVGIALGVPLLVLSPWWPTIVHHWGRALVGPDGVLDGTGAASPPWQLLLGRPGGAGLPPFWLSVVVFGTLWFVALLALRRKPDHLGVRAGWIVALGAFVVAGLSARTVVGQPPYGAETRPWTGTLLLVGFGALVVAGGVGVDRLARDLGQQSFSVIQPVMVVVSVLVAAVCLLGAGWWVVGGAAGPIQRTASSAIPPYLKIDQAGPYQVRTLAVDLDDVSGAAGHADYSVLQGDGVSLGDAERGFAFGGSQVADTQVGDLVTRLTAGTADDQIAPELLSHGIGYVWVHGADDAQRARIDNTPGLGTSSGIDENVVWKLAAPVGRVMVVTGGAVSGGTDASAAVPVALGAGSGDGADSAHGGADLPASQFGRTLRLAEPVDPRWHATLDGVALTPVAGTGSTAWQQQFQLPQGGGRLEIALDRPPIGWPIAQLVALLVIAVLAAPGVRRPEVRDPARQARRVAVLDGTAPARIDRPRRPTTTGRRVDDVHPAALLGPGLGRRIGPLDRDAGSRAAGSRAVGSQQPSGDDAAAENGQTPAPYEGSSR